MKCIEKNWSVVSLTDDRELYDYCRKYKFYYSKLNELKKIDHRFYDKDIRELVKSTEEKLYWCAMEITKLIVKQFIDCNQSVEISRCRPFDKASVTMHSDDLVRVICEIMRDRGYIS